MAATHVSSGVSTGKTVYIPYISDHSLMMQAALEHLGVRRGAAPPDDVSAKIGLDLVLGKECALPDHRGRHDTPRRPISTPRAVMLMPTAPGPCRFGQYGAAAPPARRARSS